MVWRNDPRSSDGRQAGKSCGAGSSQNPAISETVAGRRRNRTAPLFSDDGDLQADAHGAGLISCHWKLVLATRLPRLAQRRDRARRAARRARQANGRTQLHDGLIELAGFPWSSH